MMPILPECPLPAGTILLEPIVPAHAAQLFELLQAPELYTFIPHDPPASVQELEARYTRWSARQAADGSEAWLNYALFHPESRDYVGTVQATVRNTGETYIAYEVFPVHWRRRYARSACIALVDYIFASYDQVKSISALLDTRNEASWRLLESIGFRRTGTIAVADWFKGASSDEFAYGITRAEFTAARASQKGAEV